MPRSITPDFGLLGSATAAALIALMTCRAVEDEPYLDVVRQQRSLDALAQARQAERHGGGQLGARRPFGAGGEVAPPRIIGDADLKPVVMHLKTGFAHSGPEPSTNCRYCTSSLRQPRRRCAEKAPPLSMPAEPLHFSASCPCYADAPCQLADVKPSSR